LVGLLEISKNRFRKCYYNANYETLYVTLYVTPDVRLYVILYIRKNRKNGENPVIRNITPLYSMFVSETSGKCPDVRMPE